MAPPKRKMTGTPQPSRDQFLLVLKSEIRASRMPLDQTVLIIGGSSDDEDVLRRAGFRQIVNSNLPSDMGRIAGACNVSTEAKRSLDAENMDIPDESFDLVFAHAVLHHCQSPHRAFCEMLRVSRRFVMFLEPNDSLGMSLLVRLRLSFPYELPAVIGNGYRSGGLRDSQIPNFIYRWNRTEVRKAVSSYAPERYVSVRVYPYWDFSVSEEELSLRSETRIGSITSLVGTRNFISALQFARGLLNSVPVIRRQGNKFFCTVEKTASLRPWLENNNGQIVFNRKYQQRRKT